MAENALFFYGVLATFVIRSLHRNAKLGRPHMRKLVIAGWTLMAVSISATAILSLTALKLALQA